MTVAANEKLVLALPKGRIISEVMPVLARAKIEIEPEFDDPDTRQLRFATNDPGLDVIRVRNFDVATFVAFGAAQLGVAGNDVLMEFEYPEIYVPLDLEGRALPHGGGGAEGGCRARTTRGAGATCASPPNIPRSHAATSPRAASRPNASSSRARWNWRRSIGLCRRIVDLVQTGTTLKANGLVEIEHVADVTSRLIVNRAALKTRAAQINLWIERFREAADAA